MDNKYWRSENELDDGIDGVTKPFPYEVRKQPVLTEAQISKERVDFTNYFYCPVCGATSGCVPIVKRKNFQMMPFSKPMKVMR